MTSRCVISCCVASIEAIVKHWIRPLGAPAATAAAVRARVVERRTYDEVASACGCSVGAARVRVSRGLSALFDRLDRTAPEAQR